MADIVSSKIVKKGSRVLIHRPREDRQKQEIPLLEKTDSREYGRSIVDYFIVY
jgi:hypothetical protein